MKVASAHVQLLLAVSQQFGAMWFCLCGAAACSGVEEGGGERVGGGGAVLLHYTGRCC